jgi:hypothetical protein
MKISLVIVLIALGVLLPGCASVSVKREVFHPGSQPPTSPESIYVRPFALQGLRVDREGEKLTAFKTELQAGFSQMLTERLSKHIAPARAIGTAEAVPRANAWLIEGEFSRIHQGSRALRALVGWGLGGTKMDCVARVYDLRNSRKEPLAVIETTGGSNAEPGAIFGGPFGAVPRLVMTSVNSGVTPDTRRTARMITAALSEYLAKGHSALPTKPMRAKRLGEVPGLISKPKTGGQLDCR